MKYAINIEPIFLEIPFCERIKRVKEAGFDNIEFWGWANKDLDKIYNTCKENDVKITGFAGTQGYSFCDREHANQAVDWVKKSIQAAHYLECENIAIFPNHYTEEGVADFKDRYSRDEMFASVVRNLTVLAPFAEKEGVTLLLEPLNDHDVEAGVSITTTAEGSAIVRAVNSTNVRLLCDFFHMQKMHGNLTVNILNNMDIVPYVHISDAPDRFEPGTGEINYPFILSEMKKSGYTGIVCFEFSPRHTSEESVRNAKLLVERLEKIRL